MRASALSPSRPRTATRPQPRWKPLTHRPKPRTSPRSPPCTSTWRVAGRWALGLATVGLRRGIVAICGALGAGPCHGRPLPRHRGDVRGAGRWALPRSAFAAALWRCAGRWALGLATVGPCRRIVANWWALGPGTRHGRLRPRVVAICWSAGTRHGRPSPPHRGELVGAGCWSSPRSARAAASWRIAGARRSALPRSASAAASWRIGGRSALELAMVGRGRLVVANWWALGAGARHDRRAPRHPGDLGCGALEVATVGPCRRVMAICWALGAVTRHGRPSPPRRGELRGAGRSASPRSIPGAASWRITGAEGPNSPYSAAGRDAAQLHGIDATPIKEAHPPPDRSRPHEAGTRRPHFCRTAQSSLIGDRPRPP